MRSGHPSLLIRADSSPSIGSGHAMRCLALAKAWHNTGGVVSWLIAESIPAIEERLVREGFALSKMSVQPGSASDAEKTVVEAQRMGVAWAVVDGYRFFPDYIRRLKSAGLRVLFLDDDGRFDSYPADAVLNQNISASAALYVNRGQSTRLLLGPEYVLLRPEFLAHSQLRDNSSVGSKVLVTMGGSDPENVTTKVLQALPLVKTKIEVCVVVGGGYLRRDELRKLAASLPVRVQLEENPPSMVELMRWADVAISGAGSTCWELAYTGLPAIVIVQSPDQISIARGLAKRAIAVSLGDHANLSTASISQALDSLLADSERRAEMSERGRRLIDGGGAQRVVQALQDLL